MQQTTNYQLSQWDPEDRILRTDFNSDNQKIDTALKSQSITLSSLSSNISTLTTKAGLQNITSGTLSQEGQTFSVPLSGVSWDSWKAVHLDLLLYATFSAGVQVALNGDSSNGLLCNANANTSQASGIPRDHTHLIFYPLFDRWRRVNGLILGLESSQFFRNQTYAFWNATSLNLKFTDSNRFLTGSKYQLWGEK